VEGGGQAGAVVGDGVENRIDVGVGMEIGRGAGVVTRPKFALVLEFMHGVFKLGFQVGVVKLGRSFWIVQVEVFQSRCSSRGVHLGCCVNFLVSIPGWSMPPPTTSR
jgi:hypothetical protein